MSLGIVRERVMHTLLEHRAAKYGERTFLCYRDKELSFEEVNRAANQVASGLQRLGIRKGDKVAVVLDNCLEAVFLLFGLSKLGAIEVPINPAHKGELLSYMLDNSDSRMLIAHGHHVDRLEPVLASALKIESVVVLEEEIGNQGARGGSASAPLDLGRITALGKKGMEWLEIVDNDGKYHPADVLWSDPLLTYTHRGPPGCRKGW